MEGLRYLRSRFTHHKNELQEATRIDLNGSFCLFFNVLCIFFIAFVSLDYYNFIVHFVLLFSFISRWLAYKTAETVNFIV